jgi:hypothetical protein
MLIVKTELGHRVMKDRSVALTPRQRAAFILFDGKRTLDQVMSATKAVGVTREDIDRLFELGLLEDATTEQEAAQDAAQAAAERPRPRRSSTTSTARPRSGTPRPT